MVTDSRYDTIISHAKKGTSADGPKAGNLSDHSDSFRLRLHLVHRAQP